MTANATVLPLRAIPEKALRTAWSKGETFRPWSRREPMGVEKPIEEQTLADLLDGTSLDEIVDGFEHGRPPTYGEPLPESRRAWLQTGAGVLSANIRTLFEDGDSVELIEVVPDDPERNSQVYRWTPFTTVDPGVQGQILKEQQYAFSSNAVRLHFTETATGSLGFETVNPTPWRKFATTADFIAWAKGILAYFGQPKTLDDLHAAIDLMIDAVEGDPDALRYRSAYAPEEAWRFNAPAHPVWETSHERCAGGKVVATVWRGKGRDNLYDLWHARGRDTVELELGTHLIGDRELETLLGTTEDDFDENGDLL